MKVFVPGSYSSTGKDYLEMNKKISENSIKTYNENPAIVMYEGFEGLFPGTGWEILGDPTWDDDDYMAYAGYWSGWCANGGDQALILRTIIIRIIWMPGPFTGLLICQMQNQVLFPFAIGVGLNWITIFSAILCP
jgi:hypothetical protein